MPDFLWLSCGSGEEEEEEENEEEEEAKKKNRKKEEKQEEMEEEEWEEENKMVDRSALHSLLIKSKNLPEVKVLWFEYKMSPQQAHVVKLMVPWGCWLHKLIDSLMSP